MVGVGLGDVSCTLGTIDGAFDSVPNVDGMVDGALASLGATEGRIVSFTGLRVGDMEGTAELVC